MAYIIRFSDGSAEFEVSAPTIEAAERLAGSLKEAEATNVTIWTAEGEMVGFDGLDAK